MNKKQILEYRKWLRAEQSVPQNAISKHTVKEALIKDLSFFSKMSAEEYTLYKKWEEIQKDAKSSHMNKLVSDYVQIHNELPKGYVQLRELLADVESGRKIKYSKMMESYKDSIWQPERKSAYRRIEPEVILCKKDGDLTKYWKVMRKYTSTMTIPLSPRRTLCFLVNDKRTKTLLGVFALSSDYRDLKGRDDNIGWSRTVRTMKPHVMMNHTAAASSVVPTQPLGFNYAGGKLIALMAISDVAEDAWDTEYNTASSEKKVKPSKLVGVTTTSLYGAFSQYSGLIHWKSFGESGGDTCYEPTLRTKELTNQYLRQYEPRRYWEWFKGKNDEGSLLKTGATQRSLVWLYNELDIPKSLYTTGHKRGIYFCYFYENYREFLTRKITEDELIRRKNFDNRVATLFNIWRDRYAESRIKSMQDQGRYDPEGLFYDDARILTWEQMKTKWLNRVGKTAKGK